VDVVEPVDRGSRSSSVSIVTRLRLDDRGSIPGRSRDGFFLLPHPDRLWTQHAFYPGGTGVFSGVMRPRGEDDHAPPPSAVVKNARSYTFTPVIRLHGVVRS
jgi:hypothetical protein